MILENKYIIKNHEIFSYQWKKFVKNRGNVFYKRVENLIKNE